MLPIELMKKIRRLEIRTRSVAEELTGGAYRSIFKGRGIEFDEVREYTLEDDVRDIDWNVTARTGVPHIKKYIEDRELSMLLAVDISASQAFGSGKTSKHETAAELAALLAFSAGNNGDKVGLLLFSDMLELYLPPRAGRKHTLRLIRELLARSPAGQGTDIALALEEIQNLLPKRSIVFLISDFVRGGDWGIPLKIANARHDVVAVCITDNAEHLLPACPALDLADAETGETWSFSATAGQRRRFQAAARAGAEEIRRKVEQAHVDWIELRTGEDTLRPLVEFFDQRRRRLRKGGAR